MVSGLVDQGLDHGGLVVVGHLAGRHGLLGGLGTHDGDDFVFGDHLGVGLDRGFGLGLVVLQNDLHGELLAADLEPAGLLDVFQPELGRVFAALAHFGDVAGHGGVDAHLDHRAGQGHGGYQKA